MSQWTSDPASGFRNRSSAAQGHSVPGPKGGGMSSGKSDPPSGFHGRSNKAQGHVVTSPVPKKMGSKGK